MPYLLAALLGDVHRRGRAGEARKVEAKASMLAEPSGFLTGGIAAAGPPPLRDAAPMFRELSQSILEALRAAERGHALQKRIAIPGVCV